MSNTDTKGTEVNLLPLNDQILVLPLEADNKYGSLVVGDHDSKKPQIGEIIAVGHGRLDEKMRLKVGDKVFFQQHGTVEIEDNDIKYLLMPQHHCLAKWKK